MSIPEGWVLMSAWDERPDKRVGGPRGDYKRLLDAEKANKISVQKSPGVRGMLVFKAEADEYLAKLQKPCAKAAETPDTAETMLTLEVLEKIAKSLERIAVAVEMQRAT